MRGFLKIYGIGLGSCGKAGFIQKVKENLRDKHFIAKEGIEGLLSCYEKICEEIKKLIRKMERLARADEDTKRLMTVPGVGAITALVYKVENNNPHRFKHSRSVGACLGMTPRQYSLGETKRQGQISRYGSTEVRTLLTEAATVMLARSKKWNKLKAWDLKIQRKHDFKKGAVAVGHKLAAVMHRMWIDKTDFVYGEPKEERRQPQVKKIGTS